MDLPTLLAQLANGTSYGPHNGTDSYDSQRLVIRDGRAIASREWHFDDRDMDEDRGASSAILSAIAIEDLLQQALQTGRAEQEIPSVNTWYSWVRRSEAPFSPYEIKAENYDGISRLSITIQGPLAHLQFIPSLPQTNERMVRLELDRDYRPTLTAEESNF